eukprot:scaffold249_cov132-Isochrysis_galbana.AAC.2
MARHSQQRTSQAAAAHDATPESSIFVAAASAAASPPCAPSAPSTEAPADGTIASAPPRPAAVGRVNGPAGAPWPSAVAAPSPLSPGRPSQSGRAGGDTSPPARSPAALRPVCGPTTGRSRGSPRLSSSTKSFGGAKPRGDADGMPATFLIVDRSNPLSWSTRSSSTGAELALTGVRGGGRGGGGLGGGVATGGACPGVASAAAAENILEMSNDCIRLACTRSATALSWSACRSAVRAWPCSASSLSSSVLIASTSIRTTPSSSAAAATAAAHEVATSVNAAEADTPLQYEPACAAACAATLNAARDAAACTSLARALSAF